MEANILKGVCTCSEGETEESSAVESEDIGEEEGEGESQEGESQDEEEKSQEEGEKSEGEGETSQDDEQKKKVSYEAIKLVQCMKHHETLTTVHELFILLKQKAKN